MSGFNSQRGLLSNESSTQPLLPGSPSAFAMKPPVPRPASLSPLAPVPAPAPPPDQAQAAASRKAHTKATGGTFSLGQRRQGRKRLRDPPGPIGAAPAPQAHSPASPSTALSTPASLASTAASASEYLRSSLMQGAGGFPHSPTDSAGSGSGSTSVRASVHEDHLAAPSPLSLAKCARRSSDSQSVYSSRSALHPPADALSVPAAPKSPPWRTDCQSVAPVGSPGNFSMSPSVSASVSEAQHIAASNLAQSSSSVGGDAPAEIPPQRPTENPPRRARVEEQTVLDVADTLRTLYTLGSKLRVLGADHLATTADDLGFQMAGFFRKHPAGLQRDD